MLNNKNNVGIQSITSMWLTKMHKIISLTIHNTIQGREGYLSPQLLKVHKTLQLSAELFI